METTLNFYKTRRIWKKIGKAGNNFEKYEKRVRVL